MHEIFKKYAKTKIIKLKKGFKESIKMKPVVLDIETSGINFEKCGIWQIGAIDLNTGEEFFEDCRIDDEDNGWSTPKECEWRPFLENISLYVRRSCTSGEL